MPDTKVIEWLPPTRQSMLACYRGELADVSNSVVTTGMRAASMSHNPRCSPAHTCRERCQPHCTGRRLTAPYEKMLQPSLLQNVHSKEEELHAC